MTVKTISYKIFLQQRSVLLNFILMKASWKKKKSWFPQKKKTRLKVQ